MVGLAPAATSAPVEPKPAGFGRKYGKIDGLTLPPTLTPTIESAD